MPPSDDDKSNLPVPPSLVAAGVAVGVTYWSDGRRWSMFTIVCCLAYLGHKIQKGKWRQDELKERISKLEQLFQALKKKALQDRAEHKVAIAKLKAELEAKSTGENKVAENIQRNLAQSELEKKNLKEEMKKGGGTGEEMNKELLKKVVELEAKIRKMQEDHLSEMDGYKKEIAELESKKN
mmetsp:Transcript_16894/g.23815  ORF Transcript_16894/g.23815 Transcript_16894/m.23815 type:complete len:181 (+) Transcript_16894:176-718(+)